MATILLGVRNISEPLLSRGLLWFILFAVYLNVMAMHDSLGTTVLNP